MSGRRIADVSAVDRGGVVGGDGAADSWSVRVLLEGDDPQDSEAGFTVYTYAYDIRDRRTDREDEEYPWDVEEMTMTPDDVTYEHPSYRSFETFEEADEYARWAAGRDRNYFLSARRLGADNFLTYPPPHHRQTGDPPHDHHRPPLRHRLPRRVHPERPRGRRRHAGRPSRARGLRGPLPGPEDGPGPEEGQGHQVHPEGGRRPTSA